MLTVLLGLTLVMQDPDSARPLPPDAYLDSTAARIVANVRTAQARNRLVTSYTATVKQRIGVGLRALSRDRMLYRREVVARISWRRDSASTLTYVGAREGVPIATRGDQVPDDLRSDASDLVINPAEEYLRLLGGSDDEGFVYPLRTGGEADYRYAAGDTTVITLPSGNQVRLASLRVTPRRSDWRLVSGTFWFDMATWGLVQAVFRPARPFEFQRDVDEDDRDGVPGFINPVGELKFVTIEYALYENRWWMPRYMAIDLTGSMGKWLGMPVRVERVYEDYELQGGDPPPPDATFHPAGTIRRRADSTTSALRATRRACLDSASTREMRAECRRIGRQENLVVELPADTAGLLTHPELGPPILDMGDLITEEEIRGLEGAIRSIPGAPWTPRMNLPSGGPASLILRHARYNRIEALSLGVGGGVTFGPMEVSGLARLGVADLVPNGEVTVAHTGRSTQVSASAYRRLAAANPDVLPFGPFNTAFAALAHRDDGEYYRVTGGELRFQDLTSGWWEGRLFAQRERAATVETDASFSDLFGSDRTFRPNIAAARGAQYGAEFTVRGVATVSPTVTLGGELMTDGAVGTFEYGRASATTRLFLTPSGPVAGALTLAAGTSTGSVPVQHAFYLGGASTLRGYAGAATSGNAYWRSRFEIGNRFPGVRVIAFSDAGWAGDRGDFAGGRALIGAGVGVSVLDGLFRIDLARGLRSPKGWRLEFYVDGLL